MIGKASFRAILALFFIAVLTFSLLPLPNTNRNVEASSIASDVSNTMSLPKESSEALYVPATLHDGMKFIAPVDGYNTFTISTSTSQAVTPGFVKVEDGQVYPSQIHSDYYLATTIGQTFLIHDGSYDWHTVL
jgi:hypothetical protein